MDKNLIKARKLAEKIKGNPHCPECGENLDNKEIEANDFCLHTGRVKIEDGKVVKKDLSPRRYEDETVLICPNCDSSVYLNECIHF